MTNTSAFIIITTWKQQQGNAMAKQLYVSRFETKNHIILNYLIFPYILKSQGLRTTHRTIDEITDRVGEDIADNLKHLKSHKYVQLLSRKHKGKTTHRCKITEAGVTAMKEMDKRLSDGTVKQRVILPI